MSLKLNKNLGALFFLLAFFLFYFFFQSPGLAGIDAGDLVLASALGGVAHPPGYPLYTFLGWLLNKLTVGPTAAFRIGLLSSLPAAASVLVLFLIGQKVSRSSLIALIAALSLAFNYLFWFYAEIQEVFSLHLFFLFLTLYLVLSWLEKPRPAIIYWFLLITGLEFCHQHTYVLIFPALIYLFWSESRSKIKKIFSNRRFFLKAILCFLIGACFYLYLPLAPSQNPAANWWRTKDLRGWLRLLTRAEYGSFKPIAGTDFSFQNGFFNLLIFFYTLWKDFSFWGLLLVFLGAWRLSRRNQRLFQFNLIWFLFTGLVFQFFSGFPLSNSFFLATVEKFYLISYPVLFLSLAFGLVEIKDFFQKLFYRWSFLSLKMRNFLPWGVIFLTAIYPIWLLGINFRKNDLRNFYALDRLGEAVLNSCPRGGILIVAGDLITFTSQYAHFVRGVQPDLLVIADGDLKRTLFYHKNAPQLKDFFKTYDPDSETAGAAFRRYLTENKTVVCSSKPLSFEHGRTVIPWGLTEIYFKDLKILDHQVVFEGNKNFWEGYGFSDKEQAQPFFDNHLCRHLLEIYSEHTFKLTKFFYEAGDFERADFWLKKAAGYRPDSPSVLGGLVLLAIKKGDCSLARQEIERYQNLFEVSGNWLLIEETFNQECL